MIEPSTWEQFLQFVNRGGFAWKNLLGQDEVKTWTPVDASGAGLTFTSVEGYYSVVGPLVWVSATLAYPATADVSNARFGGLPFVVRNLNAGRTGHLSYHNGATATKVLLDANGRTGFFYTNAGALVTNVQMSTFTSYINAIYLRA